MTQDEEYIEDYAIELREAEAERDTLQQRVRELEAERARHFTVEHALSSDPKVQADLLALRHQVERLRGALEHITQGIDWNPTLGGSLGDGKDALSWYDYLASARDSVLQRARQALKETEKESTRGQ
jgi:hypothetical protein